jgi:hypothetical protein
MARPALLGELLVLLLWTATVGQVAAATGECGPRLVTATRGLGVVVVCEKDEAWQGLGPAGRQEFDRLGQGARTEVVGPSMSRAKSPAFAFHAESP